MSNTPNRPDLDALGKLCDAATPGPWEAAEWYGFEEGGWRAVGPHHRQREDEDGSDEPDSDSHERAKLDAAFIAAARNALPALIAYARRVEGERDVAFDAAKAAEDERRWVRVDLVNAGRYHADAVLERDALRAECERLRGLLDRAASMLEANTDKSSRRFVAAAIRKESTHVR